MQRRIDKLYILWHHTLFAWVANALLGIRYDGHQCLFHFPGHALDCRLISAKAEIGSHYTQPDNWRSARPTVREGTLHYLQVGAVITVGISLRMPILRGRVINKGGEKI